MYLKGLLIAFPFALRLHLFLGYAENIKTAVLILAYRTRLGMYLLHESDFNIEFCFQNYFQQIVFDALADDVRED